MKGKIKNRTFKRMVKSVCLDDVDVVYMKEQFIW